MPPCSGKDLAQLRSSSAFTLFALFALLLVPAIPLKPQSDRSGGGSYDFALKHLRLGPRAPKCCGT